VSLRTRVERAREAVHGRLIAHHCAFLLPAMFPIHSRCTAREDLVLLRFFEQRFAPPADRDRSITWKTSTKLRLGSWGLLPQETDGPTWPEKFGPDRKTAINFGKKRRGPAQPVGPGPRLHPLGSGPFWPFPVLGTRHSKEPGKCVQVSQGLVLTTWQRIVAFVTSITIILGGIGAAAQGWAAYSDWACQLGAWSPRACPAGDDGTPGNTTHR
jgi:hypothetical protein